MSGCHGAGDWGLVTKMASLRPSTGSRASHLTCRPDTRSVRLQSRGGEGRAASCPGCSVGRCKFVNICPPLIRVIDAIEANAIDDGLTMQASGWTDRSAAHIGLC
jgi:hypothetical protein